MKIPRPLLSRRVLQGASTLLVVGIGIQFTLWVSAHLDGRWPTVARPPGVEAFLPIGALLSLRHLVHTGVVDAVHPAGLAILLGMVLMSVVLARSFCSHLCPVGLLSELLGRLGWRLAGRRTLPPRWLDVPLRGVKYLLLAFFLWAVFLAMSPRAVAAFLESPYARVVDAKMWLLFAEPSRLTLIVLGVLLAASVLVRDAWCRYLCPLGALLGLLGRLAPLRVTRDASTCVGCRACTRACPARILVHEQVRVTNVECSSCQDCVAACPIAGCLAIRPPATRRWRLPPVAAVLVAAAVYVAVVGAFRLEGLWQTSVSEAEFHRRLPDIRGAEYTHPTGPGFSRATGATDGRRGTSTRGPPR